MTIKNDFLLILVVINTLKILKIDSSIFLQNMNMPTCQLFLLFEKSTTFWDNPRRTRLLPETVLQRFSCHI